MANDNNKSEGGTGQVERLVEQATELADKITVANFVRYVGPGVVLFGLVKVSKVPFCQQTVNAFKPDKGDSAFLILLFLVVGSLVHTAYRAFFYNKLIVALKDCEKLKLRSWYNYREVLRIRHVQMRDRGEKLCHRIKGRYERDWVWRRLKVEFFKDYEKHDPGMALWSSSIHLLYFAGISVCLLAIPEWWCGGWRRGVFYLSGGIVTFIAGLWADREYERAETYLYESLLDSDKVNKFLEKLFTLNAFRAQGTNPNEAKANEKL